MFKRRSLRLFAATLGLLLFICLPTVSVLAATKTTTKDNAKVAAPDQNISGQIIQSYSASSPIQTGILVKLKDKSAGVVEPLKAADVSKMLGVVVPPNNAAVTLAPETVNQQQVYVATSGRYEVLVSNQNGAINVGDLISVSALTGVGMRADESQFLVLGKAVTGFSGTKQVISSVKLKDQSGHESTVAIGRITVDLSIAHNPLLQKATDFVPAFLSHAATAIASKPISVARIYLGMGIIIVSGFITANTIYSGVRSGMVAVGRNPLSKKSIVKSLFQTILAGLIIFIAGVFAVYLLLKL